MMNAQKILFAVALLFAGTAFAQPAYVQSGYGECYPATTCPVSFDRPVKAGSLLVASIRTDTNGAKCTSVTSMPGNRTWTVDRRQLSPTNFYVEVWSLPNATGGSTTVTVTCSGPPDQMRVVLTEYSGIAISDHVNATTSGGDTSATADAGNITTTVTNTLIHVAAAADHNSDADTFTPEAGYTVHDLGPDPAGSDKTMTQHRVATSPGTYGTKMGNINDTWAAVAVAYKPSGGDLTPPAAPKNVRLGP